jgi:hypothetical protein
LIEEEFFRKTQTLNEKAYSFFLTKGIYSMIVWMIIWIFKIPAAVWHVTEPLTLDDGQPFWTDIVHMLVFMFIFSFGTWLLLDIPWAYHYTFEINKDYLNPGIKPCRFICKAYFVHLIRMIMNATVFILFIIAFDEFILVEK